MDYTPLKATVVIRPPKIKQKTDAGIIKSTDMLNQEKLAWDGSVDVVLTGPECQYVKKGQKVLLQTNAIMHPVIINKEEFLQVEEYAILGIFN
ncbi:MAG: hypothetical protein QGH06_05670 [Lutibacter sp.]|jgi:co-chaperonin GroES (HSP10)|nr:hypothetical protein [Lutibacter sp.]